MMQKIITLCLIVVGLINFAPVLGVLSVQNIEAAYGLGIADSNIGILMRHRALLFGILGGFVLCAAFIPRYQVAAMSMAGASMIGYAMLVLGAGGYNPMLAKVLVADFVGITFLCIAIILKIIAALGKNP
ncbi:MAG: phosphopantetheine adenylyltransferase [Pseudomonadales bacterium]|nr:phosphopantetheine adenylyltransferase [Pseudomonadales bacterium]